MRWALILTIVAANASGDVMNAEGMRRRGEVRDFHPVALVQLARSLVHNRFVIGGLAMMVIAFAAQLSLLSIADLSFALPATASSYLLETLLAKWVLKEHISRLRWVGAGLVGVGVLLLQY